MSTLSESCASPVPVQPMQSLRRFQMRAVSLFFCLVLLTAPALCFAFSWHQAEPGFEITILPFGEVQEALTIVRVDPAHFRFFLCTASGEKSSPRSLASWARLMQLHLATNASMYLKDGLTSTGYMRQGNYVNNPRISRRFGAFFVAHPDLPDLPEVDILERDSPNLNETLAHYHLVIQNYRLISKDRHILWPKIAASHATACVGMDESGRVLFIFCRCPVTPHALARELLNLPLALSTTMYVEGGSQAGLYVSSKADAAISRLFPFFDISPVLPNVLGVRRK